MPAFAAGRRIDLGDERALVGLRARAHRRDRCHRLHADAEPAAHDATALLELRQDLLGHVARHANPIVLACGLIAVLIPTTSPARLSSGTARVAGIDRASVWMKSS
jgi:hypothetical protein